MSHSTMNSYSLCTDYGIRSSSGGMASCIARLIKSSQSTDVMNPTADDTVSNSATILITNVTASWAPSSDTGVPSTIASSGFIVSSITLVIVDEVSYLRVDVENCTCNVAAQFVVAPLSLSGVPLQLPAILGVQIGVVVINSTVSNSSIRVENCVLDIHGMHLIMSSTDVTGAAIMVVALLDVVGALVSSSTDIRSSVVRFNTPTASTLVLPAGLTVDVILAHVTVAPPNLFTLQLSPLIAPFVTVGPASLIDSTVITVEGAATFVTDSQNGFANADPIASPFVIAGRVANCSIRVDVNVSGGGTTWPAVAFVTGAVVSSQTDLTIAGVSSVGIADESLIYTRGIGTTDTPILVNGGAIRFANFTVQRSRSGGEDAQRSLINASSSAPLHLDNCRLYVGPATQVSGFATVLGGAVAVSSNVSATVDCDGAMWDGGAVDTRRTLGGYLAQDVITATGGPLPHTCVRPTSTSTLADVVPPSVLDTAALGATNSAVVGATVVSLMTGGGVALPAMQGVLGALRLARRCELQRQKQGSGDDGADDDADAVDSSDSPLGVSLTALPRGLEDVGGAVLGNAVFVVGVTLVAHTVCVARRTASYRKVVAAGRCGRLVDAIVSLLPSSLLPAAVSFGHAALLEPSLRAAIILVGSASRTAGTVALGVSGVVCWAASGLLLGWAVCARGGGLSLVLQPVPRRRNLSSRALTALEWAAAPRWRWRRAVSAAGDVLARYGVLVEPYDRKWFFVVEMCTAVGNAVVLGAAWVAEDACAATEWGTALTMVLALAQAALCVWLRPHVSLADGAVTVSVCALSVVADALVWASLEDAAASVSAAGTAVSYVPVLLGLAVGVMIGRQVLLVSLWATLPQACVPGTPRAAATRRTMSYADRLAALRKLIGMAAAMTTTTGAAPLESWMADGWVYQQSIKGDPIFNSRRRQNVK